MEGDPFTRQIRRRNNMLSRAGRTDRRSVRAGKVIPQEKAVPESEEVGFLMHRRWAGLTFVFPVRDDLARKRLELHIMQALRWIELPTKLVTEFGISGELIYEIVEEKHRRQQKDQMTLFGQTNEPGLRFYLPPTFYSLVSIFPIPSRYISIFLFPPPRYFSPSL
ncbi:hypothetical protein P4053_16520, partial [Pseudomonas aeruginosa]|nr:hypothetical protein [Pseudomonas aeruginosa]